MSATAQSIGFGEAGPSIFALLGAPNCGKTVLFNGLTGSHAKVANYPGVTVDKREGKFVRDANIRIIDLPGTYSLRTTSPDEAVARERSRNHGLVRRRETPVRRPDRRWGSELPQCPGSAATRCAGRERGHATTGRRDDDSQCRGRRTCS